jgi:aminoglycoside phosphotransferase (APT) family kinase protein
VNNETPVATGRDADVYAIDGDRVLRRYRAGGDVAQEAAVMTYLAGHGFPVPTVFHAAGTDMVMRRVSGPSMLTALRDNGIDASSAAVTLAGLHRRLHRIPARVSTDPAVRVLHLDLHPDNVLLGPDGPVLIDWRNSTEGPPDLDTAMSALILATAAVGEDPGLATLAGDLLPPFLHAVDGAPQAQLDRVVAMRSVDPNLTEREVADLARAANLIREIIAEQ